MPKTQASKSTIKPAPTKKNTSKLKAVTKPKVTVNIDKYDKPFLKIESPKKNNDNTSIRSALLKQNMPEIGSYKITTLSKKNKDNMVVNLNEDSVRTMNIRKKVSGFQNDNSPQALKQNLHIDMTPLTKKNLSHRSVPPKGSASYKANLEVLQQTPQRILIDKRATKNNKKEF